MTVPQAYPLSYPEMPGDSRLGRIERARQERRGGHLVVGEVAAEFGHELMSCGPLRRFVHKNGYRRVTISTRPGREALYADFATDFKPHGIQCESDCMSGYELRDGQRHCLPVSRPDVPPDAEWYPPTPYQGGDAEWHVYGHPDPKWSGVTVVHARNRKHCPERNWRLENWVRLIEALRQEGMAQRVVCIGSVSAAMAIPGCEDARGLPLDKQMDVLHSAFYAVGVSSGPMHLAEHCRCPVAVWCSGGDGESRQTQSFYQVGWNPFAVPCVAERLLKWYPAAHEVLLYVKRLIALLAEKADAL